MIPDGLDWRKSSYSADSNCVEMAETLDGGIVIRNSQRPMAATVWFSRGEIRAFLLGAKAGEFDNMT